MANPLFAQHIPNNSIDPPALPVPDAQLEKQRTEQQIKECKAKGAQWITNLGAMPRCMSNEDLTKLKQAELDCHKDRGRWGPQGLMRMPGCVRQMPDANKPCQRSADCVSKSCLVDPSTKKHGKCAETDSGFGCQTWFVSEADRKKLSPGTATSLCVD